MFWPTRVTPSQLRIDRILDEARHTADPIQLMRLFGIAANTAMRYVKTAHPTGSGSTPPAHDRWHHAD